MKYLVISLIALMFSQGCKQEAVPQSGRFQILSSPYEETDLTAGEAGDLKTKINQRHGLFRIDTATGKLWRYNSSTFISTNGVNSVGLWEDAEFTNKVKF